MSNGKALEDFIDLSNRYYKKHDHAHVIKIPTPVKIIRKNGSRIRDGFTMKAEFIDYVGTLKNGESIAFEAKSTMNESFDIIHRLKEHQYLFLESFNSMGAYSFIIVGFMEQNEFYIMTFEEIEKHYEAIEQGGKKSINRKEFAERYKKIEIHESIGLDYIKAVL